MGKSTRLLFRRSGVQIPATTWWLTTIRNEIWRPLLECLKTASVYLHIINKYLKKKKKKKNFKLNAAKYVTKKKKKKKSHTHKYTHARTTISSYYKQVLGWDAN